MVMRYLIEVSKGLYVSAFMYIIVCAVLGIFASLGLNSKKNLSSEVLVVTSNDRAI
jgi:hypothetical protein